MAVSVTALLVQCMYLYENSIYSLPHFKVSIARVSMHLFIMAIVTPKILLQQIYARKSFKFLQT